MTSTMLSLLTLPLSSCHTGESTTELSSLTSCWRSAQIAMEAWWIGCGSFGASCPSLGRGGNAMGGFLAWDEDTAAVAPQECVTCWPGAATWFFSSNSPPVLMASALQCQFSPEKQGGQMDHWMWSKVQSDSSLPVFLLWLPFGMLGLLPCP
ncbi:hypothetical protein F5148DRAFT_1224908 [Russula earlei]|uniref:Uncharacterized protein n=1 Tax=Russula earlei TaxID=71964 RepID=A0ACC0U0F5_9AGAM|nr:hypothetical protein F5148DRAFT_1224908 [Russula earlei]